MRKYILKGSGYLHAVLLLTLLMHAVFLIIWKGNPATERYLYGIFLLILLPAAVTGRAQSRCRGLGAYLLFSLLALAVSEGIVYLLASSLFSPERLLGCQIVFGLAGVWLVLDRLFARLHNSRREKEGEVRGMDALERPGIFEKPYWGCLAVFVTLYIIGLFTATPLLCTEALISLALYFGVTVLYQFVSGTEEYLHKNYRVKNVPSKRIYGINSVFCLVFLSVAAIFAIIAVITSQNRRYIKLEAREIHWEEAPVQQGSKSEPTEYDMLALLMEESGPATEPPAWLDDAMRILTAAVLVVFVIALVRAIRELFARFREQKDENGDVVEELTDAVQTIQSVKGNRRQEALSERERIRRRFRKTIRKYRKGNPSPHETPYEMEAAAKIADTIEGRKLHELYEKARYDKWTT